MATAQPGGGRAPLGRRPVIKVLPPDDVPYAALPPTPRPDSLSTERTRAKIVVSLSFACTVLSVYDLYLLMVGG